MQEAGLVLFMLFLVSSSTLALSVSDSSKRMEQLKGNKKLYSMYIVKIGVAGTVQVPR